jgi:predicted nucleic acid-binding protein
LPAISNTSPLIWLAKIGKLSLLKELFFEVLVPEEVYKEAVERGLQEGFSDALLIREGFSQGWIKVSRLNEDEAALCKEILNHAFEIHIGEAQAIVVARRIGASALLLMDESSGRAFAEAWGLKVNGVIYVIMMALRRGLLSGAEAKEAVLTLVQKGFRVEPKLLARMIREIDAYKKGSTV